MKPQRERVDGVGVGEFDRGREFALGDEHLGTVEIDDGGAGLDQRARMQGGGVTFYDATGDPRDDHLQRAVVVADGAVAADRRHGRTGRDGGERDAHAALLFAGEFARGYLCHLHSAHRTVARQIADEVHHRAGPAFAGDARVFVGVPRGVE